MLPWLLALALSAADPLCAPTMQALWPQACLNAGPGGYAAQVAALPDVAEFPAPATVPVSRPANVLAATYAQVTTPSVPLFATPEDALNGVVARSAGKGFIFVNLVEAVPVGDQLLYKIRAGEYIRAEDVQMVQPSAFAGVGLETTPERPLGWLVSMVRPSPRPGAIVANDTRFKRLPRYQRIQVFAEVQVGSHKWYQIGPDQWVEERTVALAVPQPRPTGVTGRWVAVNLYEQTLTAYEDDRMVYATLISSGLDKWPTRPGLFEVYARLRADRMRGAAEPDFSDFYSLEDVPYVLYFDGDIALHGQYWHDRLGFKRSHGCVNLAPADARWVYDFARRGTPVLVVEK